MKKKLLPREAFWIFTLGTRVPILGVYGLVPLSYYGRMLQDLTSFNPYSIGDGRFAIFFKPHPMDNGTQHYDQTVTLSRV